MLSRVNLKIRSQQIKVRTVSQGQPESRTELIGQPGIPYGKAWASATFGNFKKKKWEIKMLANDPFAPKGIRSLVL